METKVTIFLLFVSLARSAYVPELNVDYGLSADKALLLKEIILDEEAAITATAKAFVPIFDLLRKFAAELVLGLKTTTEVDLAKVTEGRCSLNDATDITLHSMLLVLDGCCAASLTVEGNRNEAYDHFYDAFEAIVSALNSATSCESYSEIETMIEEERVKVLESLIDTANGKYDLISQCLDTTDPEIRDLLETARNGSSLGLLHLTNAVFTAIKAYAAAASCRYADASLTCDLDIYQAEALMAMESDHNYKFSILRAVFINLNLNQSGITSVVALSQRTETESFHAYKKAIEVLFTIPERDLKEINLGFYDDGEIPYSRSDIAIAMVNAQLDLGDRSIFELIAIIHPDIASEIDEALELVHNSNVEGSETYLAARSVAKNKSIEASDAREIIEDSRNTGVDGAPDLTYVFFELIRNDMTFDEETEAKLVSLEDLATYGIEVFSTRFFDAYLIILNAVRAGEASTYDFSTVKALKLETIAGLEAFCQAVTAASLLVFQFMSAN